VSGCTENPSRPQKLTGVAKPAVGTAVLGAGRIRAARPPSAVVLGLLTGKRDGQGRPVRVACQTCHQKIVTANADVYRKADASFHADIKLRHGRKTCRTCHRLPHFTDFNLADGTPVAHGDVMVLCGQCHSRRLVEYQNGAHGGMTGFWDRKRGVRQRNHCLDCHNPHSPGIPRVRPAPRARNRRLR
jgi:hypothetical protein